MNRKSKKAPALERPAKLVPLTTRPSSDYLSVPFWVTLLSALAVSGIASMVAHYYMIMAYKAYLVAFYLHYFTTFLLVNFLLCLFFGFAYEIRWKIGKMCAYAATVASTIVTTTIFFALFRNVQLVLLLGVFNALVCVIAAALGVLSAGGRM